MTIYFVKRLISIIAGFFVFSILLFFIGQFTVNDIIVLQQFNIQDRVNITSIKADWELIRIEKRKRNLDLPSFYYSIYRSSSSDTLYQIEDDKVKNTLMALSYHHGSWEAVHHYFQLIKTELFSSKNSSEQKQQLLHLLHSVNIEEHTTLLERQIKENYPQIFNSGFQLIQQKASWLSHLSFRFKWNGLNNRYHTWVSNLFNGDLGKSYTNNEAVGSKIRTSIFWTVFFSICSILIALIIAIPLALFSVHPRLKNFSSFLEKLFLTAYAIPRFWMATLLILFLASGSYFLIFPVYGLGYISDHTSFFEIIRIRSPYLVLPIFCLTYGSIAYLYKQMKNAITNEMEKDYVKTAFSKGLSFKKVLIKHVFKNASFPIITILGGLLPALISGSFIVENIFAIPGMGKLTLDAFFQRDLPVIFGILMITYVLTAIGLLIADLFYQLNDPRVSFRQNSNG